MNALEELREMERLQDSHISITNSPKLSDIADRIENEYMELPRDKNGEVIHVGDILKSANPYGRIASGSKVDMISVRDTRYSITLDGFTLYPESLIHDKPDTWEQIEASAKEHDRSCVDSLCVGNAADLVRRCKRLAGVNDDR